MLFGLNFLSYPTDISAKGDFAAAAADGYDDEGDYGIMLVMMFSFVTVSC